jgi:peptidoglycan/xylan/chitin deacetylase (PgdA/CDA1 family)
VYHSIGSNGSFFTVPPHEFARQIEYLKRDYTIVSLGDVFEYANGGRELPKRSVAITLDDGYYDNFVNVYPYVKKYGFPLSIFVISGLVGKEMVLGNVKLKMLGWKELSVMSENGVIIGAHTRNHPDLQSLSSDDARYEMQTSKTDIERAIEKTVNFFAYPKSSYNSSLIGLAKSVGFKAAFGGDGVILQGNHNFLLRRVPIDASVNFFMFKCKLTLAEDWYRRIEIASSRLIRKMPFFSAIAVIYNSR